MADDKRTIGQMMRPKPDTVCYYKITDLKPEHPLYELSGCKTARELANWLFDRYKEYTTPYHEAAALIGAEALFYESTGEHFAGFSFKRKDAPDEATDACLRKPQRGDYWGLRNLRVRAPKGCSERWEELNAWVSEAEKKANESLWYTNKLSSWMTIGLTELDLVFRGPAQLRFRGDLVYASIGIEPRGVRFTEITGSQYAEDVENGD